MRVLVRIIIGKRGKSGGKGYERFGARMLGLASPTLHPLKIPPPHRQLRPHFNPSSLTSHENTIHETCNFASRRQSWSNRQDYLTAGFLEMLNGARVIGWLLMAAPKVGGLRIGMRSYFGRYRKRPGAACAVTQDDRTAGPSLES